MTAPLKTRRRERFRKPSLPKLGAGDAGPLAAGRGPLQAETLLVESHDQNADAAPMVPVMVVRSMVGHGFKALDPERQETARRYAG